MKHDRIDDDLRALAAAYVLDALEADEKAAFSAHLADGCEVCVAEVEGFSVVTDSLGSTADAIEAPASLRDRVLSGFTNNVPPHIERAADGTTDTSAFAEIVRGDDIAWEPFAPGVRVKTLRANAADGRVTQIVEMQPGVSMPIHHHTAAEEVYILSGDCHIAPGVALLPGDYFRAEAGTDHAYTFTENGTTFLAIYDNEFPAE